MTNSTLFVNRNFGRLLTIGHRFSAAPHFTKAVSVHPLVVKMSTLCSNMQISDSFLLLTKSKSPFCLLYTCSLISPVGWEKFQFVSWFKCFLTICNPPPPVFLPAGESCIPPPRAVHHWERSVNSNSQSQEGRAQNSLPATDRQTVR